MLPSELNLEKLIKREELEGFHWKKWILWENGIYTEHRIKMQSGPGRRQQKSARPHGRALGKTRLDFD